MSADADLDVDRDPHANTAPGAERDRDRHAPRTIALPLHGVEVIQVEGSHMVLTIRGDDSLDGVVALDTGGGEHAPQLVAHGGVVNLTQTGTHEPRGASPVLRVPSTGCPPICGFLGGGPTTVRDVNATISLATRSDGLTLRGGMGPASLAAQSGGITVADRAGELTVDAGSGGVHLTRCAGPATVRAASGGLHLEDCQGDLNASVRSGGVRVVRPRAQRIKVEARSGGTYVEEGSLAGLDIAARSGGVTSTAALQPSDAPYHVECSSGNVFIQLPPGIPLRVEATAKSGRVRSDVPLVSVGRPGPQSDARRYVGVSDEGAGAGAPRVDVRVTAGSGNIDLPISGSAAAAAGTFIITASGSPGAPGAIPGSPSGGAATTHLTAGGNTRELSAVAPSASVPSGLGPAVSSSIPRVLQQDTQPAPVSTVSTREGDVHAILDALERKDITVDEAEALLDRLG